VKSLDFDAMTPLTIRYHRGGVHLPKLGLWLDPREPQTGADKVFISHAHSDHIGTHREVIVTAPTSRLMRARLDGKWIEHILPFGQTTPWTDGTVAFQLTLLPAGHIFGSAMALVEAEGASLLYTGDFKLRPSLSAEPCEPRAAETLIMETTYGRRRYRFPPAAEVLPGVIRFCREALDNEETPVLLGYSLGKSQELLRGLASAGLPIMLHAQIHKLTEIYKQFGQPFPPSERFESASARGNVLLCPPGALNSAAIRNLGQLRTAILTGWAVDPNCRYRYQTDAAFPLSDHADFTELIELVKQVNPKKVYTLHGFAADFALTLREMGYDAEALSEEEQLSLPLLGESQRLEAWPAWTDSVTTAPTQNPPADSVLGGTGYPPVPSGDSPDGIGRASTTDDAARFPAAASSIPVGGSPTEVGGSPTSPISAPSNSFQTFAASCSAIGATAKKLEKIQLLADYLKSLEVEALAPVNTWFTGHPFPPSQNKVLQLGWAVIRDALCVVGGMNHAEFGQVYLKHSDLGETAAEILPRMAPTSAALTIGAVETLFQQLYAARGPLGKLPLLTQALRQCSAPEGKYLIKVLTGDLRIGLKEGLVEEAIARAFAASLEEVKNANLLLGNIGETTQLARRGLLTSATLVPFRPLKYMLASPEETAEAIWKRVQEWPGSSDTPLFDPADLAQAGPARSPVPAPRPPVWIEDKYDGIRCQLHKVGDRVALYSRDLKEITATFLELADAARSVAKDFILDGEILAMRGNRALPFPELQRRLGRREGDLFLSHEIPIQFIAFDLLWLEGESFLNKPLRTRRQALEELSYFRAARITPAISADEIESAFAAARVRGNEGLMIKDPASVYTPGRRGLAWLKLKKAFGTLDCVVVGAEYGQGKRHEVLSDYTFAVRDESTGELKTIGKAYIGLTDLEIGALTKHFLSKVIRRNGRYLEVEPDTVLEIAFDAIQPSARHASGLAMRFPRIARIRPDKSPADIDTLSAARRFLRTQA
jgi:DNA ligase-1